MNGLLNLNAISLPYNKINDLNKILTIKSNRVVEFETDISKLDEVLKGIEKEISNE